MSWYIADIKISMITIDAIRKGSLIINCFETNVTFSLEEIETTNSSL